MNFKEMQDYLIERTRSHTTAKLSNIKLTLNMAMDIVVKERNRPFLMKEATISTVSAQYDDYVLNDSDIDIVNRIIVTDESNPMQEISYEDMLDWYPTPSDVSPGTPTHWALKRISGVKEQPSSASVLAVVSSSTSDTEQIVRIVGEDTNGGRIQEEETLTGTSAVSTTAQFVEIYSIEKSARAVGRVTITSNSAEVTNALISPDALGSRYLWLRIHPIPDGVYTMELKCKKLLHPMVDDRDVPGDIWDRDFQNAILGVAESLILDKPQLAAATLNADKSNLKVQATIGFKTIDRRAYRTSLETGRRY